MLREIAIWLPQSAAITTAGDLQRVSGQGRIAFLAQVRNAALAPLWTVSNPVYILLDPQVRAEGTGPLFSDWGPRIYHSVDSASSPLSCDTVVSASHFAGLDIR